MGLPSHPSSKKPTVVVIDNPKDESLQTRQSHRQQAEYELIRKIDLRLLSLLIPLNLLLSLDRSNMGLVRLFNFETNLKFNSDQYQWGLMIFFIGYLSLGSTAPWIARQASSRVWLAFIILASGAMTASLAAVKDFSSYMCIRFFLGVFEAGFFPGVVCLLGLWYTRQEQTSRIALITSAATVSGAVAGIVAYLLIRFQGTGGLFGWQWIFLVQGIPTIALGIAALFVIPKDPKECNWITAKEYQILSQRLTPPKNLELPAFKTQLKVILQEYKTYIYCLLFIGVMAPANSLMLYMPSIIKDLGFTNINAIIATIPPYIVALSLKFGLVWHSQKINCRAPHLTTAISLGFVGFMLMLFTSPSSIRYLGTILAYSGSIAAIPILLSWATTNMSDPMFASGFSSLLMFSGGVSTILSSLMYRTVEAPNYNLSHIINVSALGGCLILTIILRECLQNENQDMELTELVHSTTPVSVYPSYPSMGSMSRSQQIEPAMTSPTHYIL